MDSTLSYSTEREYLKKIYTYPLVITRFNKHYNFLSVINIVLILF